MVGLNWWKTNRPMLHLMRHQNIIQYLLGYNIQTGVGTKFKGKLINNAENRIILCDSNEDLQKLLDCVNTIEREKGEKFCSSLKICKL